MVTKYVVVDDSDPYNTSVSKYETSELKERELMMSKSLSNDLPLSRRLKMIDRAMWIGLIIVLISGIADLMNIFV